MNPELEMVREAKRFEGNIVIILNWNGWEDTIECLESLYKITCTDYDVMVVDNGSEDDTVKGYLYKEMTNLNLVIK